MTGELFFKLNEEFLLGYKGKQPKFGPIGHITYKRTYSRLKENGKSEEFWETIKRVVEGCFTIQRRHCDTHKLPWNHTKAQKSAQRMFELIWEFKFTPPGRGLWMMGTQHLYEKGGMCLNNCAFVSTEDIALDFAEPFCFLMDVSMLGVGVGSDIRGVSKVTIQEPKNSELTFVVEDSREGWVELLRELLNSYVGRGSLPKDVDYSKLRPYGSPIKGFGGVSSGPEPLKEMYNDITELLDTQIGKKVTSTIIVDIFNLIGRCVVSGGVRRTAEIMFGDYRDKEFINLKDPKKHKKELMHHRWASNNSIFADIGMDYTEVAEKTALNGEPGYQWLENARDYSRMGGVPDFKDYRVSGANPCNEQSLESYEVCCLVETYPSKHETLEEWIETLKYAYLYAKSVTLVSTHNERTNAVMLRNRRIGCSISGITQVFKKFGRRKFFKACDKGYKKIQDWDKTYSEWLCIPKSIKTTSIKPSGTVSLLNGVTPGIHYPISEYYIRNIRFQEGNPLLIELKKSGYKVEKDKYSKNTHVVSFPVKEDYFDRGVRDVSMWEQLENAAQIQTHWSDNQVSITVSFDKNEAKDIKYALELYETRLKGVSFLPKTEHGFEQAPYIPISKEKYEELISETSKIKLKGVVHEELDKFCDGDICKTPK